MSMDVRITLNSDILQRIAYLDHLTKTITSSLQVNPSYFGTADSVIRNNYETGGNSVKIKYAIRPREYGYFRDYTWYVFIALRGWQPVLEVFNVIAVVKLNKSCKQ